MDQNIPFRDRRKKPTPPLSPYLFRGRRRRVPPGVGENYYVDRPHWKAWSSVILLLCLSILDARLSLLLFSTGRLKEFNPLLLAGLQLGDGVFLAMKFTLTISALLILLIHWNFVLGKGAVRVLWLKYVLIVAYLLIVVYEIALLYFHY